MGGSEGGEGGLGGSEGGGGGLGGGEELIATGSVVDGREVTARVAATAGARAGAIAAGVKAKLDAFAAALLSVTT